MSKRKVLVVDDSEVIRKRIRDLLESLDFDVVEAEDGLKGLEAIEKESQFSLVISDVNMPNMDGLAMCEQLKKKVGFSAPILMLTTEASREMKDEGKRIGVRGWVLKPFDPQSFINVIKILTTPKAA